MAPEVPAPTIPQRRGPITLLDLHWTGDRRNQWRRVPKLILGAVRLVWQASRRHFLTTIALQAGAGVAIAVQLLAAKELITGLTSAEVGGSVVDLLPEIMAIVAAMAVLGVLAALAAHQQQLLGELVGRHALDRVVEIATAVDYRFFEIPDFYDQLQRARNSGMYRSVAVVGAIGSLSMALLTSVAIAAVLFVLQPLLLIFVVLAAFPVLLATLHNSRAAYQFEYDLTPEGRERAYLLGLLTAREAGKEVRVFGAGTYLRRRYDEIVEERLRRFRRFVRERLVVSLVGTLAGAVGTAVGLVTLVVLLVHGRLDLASAVTAALAMQQLGSRLSAATTSVGNLVSSGMFIDDYLRFLALAPDVTSEPAASGQEQPAPARRPFRGAAAEGVSFSYPGATRPALEDVSIEVRPGEVVALVGENGSGKTTLVKLMCQLYRPDSGRILWNGADAAALRPEEITSDMTVLFQDFIQYHLSARDNIALGRTERGAESSAITAAAQQAGADEFIESLPRGYESRLGREFFGGLELSVGQWQRLALARAFFRDAGFLVLDEPTASLDPRAEHDLFRQIRKLTHGRSVLLVSHRFSSVRSADRIYVLHNGRVVEHGTHAELMACHGHYAELFKLQAVAYLGEASA